MKKSVICVLILILAAPLLMAQDKNTEAAQKAAESWLALLDKGDYVATYDQAASTFKARVTKEQWVHGVKGVREPLGSLVSRKLLDAREAKSLPGAPDGDYVVLHFDTSFAHKQSATETIVPMLDKDGQWRVSGYFVK